MRKILIQVWQQKLSPGRALNILQDMPEFAQIRDDDQIFYMLETLREKAITVSECEQEIDWILNN